MRNKPKRRSRLWYELKRRGVPKVMAMYAATAFIIMEAVDIMLPRLGLPEWTVTLVIILLIIGLPVAFVLSWVFDITPQGVVKTGSLEDTEVFGEDGESNAPQRRKLRASDVVIALLLIVVIFLAYPKISGKWDSDLPREMRGKVSIAVMPFKNMTGDSIYNLWQEGMQNLLITSLSNSQELSVRQYETMNSLLGNEARITYASLTPSRAGELAQKVDANTVISGSLHKSGNIIRITANIMNAETEEIYKSYELDGNTEDDFFSLADSISENMRNFLEIRNMSKVNLFDTGDIFTQSANAYKLYIQGLSCHQQLDYSCAAEYYNKAIQIDSNFVSAMLKLAFCYGDMRQAQLSKSWAYKAYERIDQLPPDMQLLVNAVKASVDKMPRVQLNYCRQYLQQDPHSIYMTYMAAWIHFNLEQWSQAIEGFEKSLEMLNKLNSHPWSWTYILLGRAYHFEGSHKKEEKIFETGKEYWPEQSLTFVYWQAICAVSLGDSELAQVYLDEIGQMLERNGLPEANQYLWYAGVHSWAESYEIAEEYYRKALALRPGNERVIYEFAEFLISKNINTAEGMEMLAPLLEKYPDNAYYLYVKGVGLYNLGEYQEASEALNRSWKMRSYYDHKHFTIARKVDDLLNRS